MGVSIHYPPQGDPTDPGDGWYQEPADDGWKAHWYAPHPDLPAPHWMEMQAAVTHESGKTYMNEKMRGEGYMPFHEFADRHPDLAGAIVRHKAAWLAGAIVDHIEGRT